MDFVENSTKLPVQNFDVIAEQEKRVKRHGNLLPSTIRAIISGPSDCGKTNSLLALVTHLNRLRFENIYIYSKSLNQAKYKFLQKIINSIDGMQYLPFSNHDEVVSPDDTLPNSIMTFDDIACEKQSNFRAFYLWVDTKMWIAFI